MKIYPYKPGSASAKALSEALGVKRIRHEGDVRKPPNWFDQVILNWGSSGFKRLMGIHPYNILNHPENVAIAGNKLETFKALSGHVPIPDWTEERVEALQWLGEGFTVVSRTVLTGHSGAGIFLKRPEDQGVLKEAPLYTKYIKKKDEYRLHVFRDNVFFVQRKARKKDVPDDQVNWQIRNHGNGFIFAHEGVDVPARAKLDAIMAVKQLGLDFGAVDVVHGTDGKFYILEVNTAPGLEGTTLQKYVEVFKEFL